MTVCKGMKLFLQITFSPLYCATACCEICKTCMVRKFCIQLSEMVGMQYYETFHLCLAGLKCSTNKTYKMFLNECNEPCFKFNPPFYAKHVYYTALARCAAAVTSVLFSFEFKEEPCQGLVLPALRRLNDPRFQSNFVCCSGRLFRRSMIAW